MRTFGLVIEAFGGPAKFGTAIGIPAGHARVMKFRDSIPPGYWPAIVSAAIRLRITGITFEMLASCSARKQRGGQRRAA
jgi:hypothetical protein